ncbi:hypothetical protein EV702DRAFT_1196147 [Suillus placidus]|uniref:Uncharacterized protein n=1 Tax=Suillus placidus TaxID=48579 RepID=A0A9P7D3A0_9AGAM|nr:hypothetical protein EV702DRAFT_1196147 [Suillus placidus]
MEAHYSEEEAGSAHKLEDVNKDGTFEDTDINYEVGKITSMVELDTAQLSNSTVFVPLLNPSISLTPMPIPTPALALELQLLFMGIGGHGPFVLGFPAWVFVV